jgi:Fe-S cluster assembly ATP-binding protein
MAPSALGRAVNVAFSGGEKKRNETVQLAVLQPRIAVIDEIDSGLDIDALREVARRIEQMTQPRDDGGEPLGVLAITHYARLLSELRPDRVHVLRDGQVVMSGGPELADELEQSGYEGVGIPDGDALDLRGS